MFTVSVLNSAVFTDSDFPVHSQITRAIQGFSSESEGEASEKTWCLNHS